MKKKKDKKTQTVLFVGILTLVALCSGCMSDCNGLIPRGYTITGIVAELDAHVCQAPQEPSKWLAGFHNGQPYFKITTFDGSNNPHVEYCYDVNGQLIPVDFNGTEDTGITPVVVDTGVSWGSYGERIIGGWRGDQFGGGNRHDQEKNWRQPPSDVRDLYRHP